LLGIREDQVAGAGAKEVSLSLSLSLSLFLFLSLWTLKKKPGTMQRRT
jgi:hypothetical protein